MKAVMKTNYRIDKLATRHVFRISHRESQAQHQPEPGDSHVAAVGRK